MTLDAPLIDELARILDSAEIDRRPVTKVTDKYPQMDWQDAYAIQYSLRAIKQSRGHRIRGMKMGLTSRAKMLQMNVVEPVYGFLTDYGAIPDGGEVRMVELIQPRIEAEIAFVTRRDLSGPGCHIGQVLAATDFILPAVEILDSRYEHFKFDLKSVVADNTSAARYVTGSVGRAADRIDLRHLGVVIEKNGEIVATAAGAAVLGHPAASVAMLANMLARRRESIPAGTFIMTGGLTEALAVGAGDHINVRYQDLGNVSMRFV